MHRTVHDPNWTVKQATSNAAFFKDSDWLKLEVCRENQRNKCKRDEHSCRYAHPPPSVVIHDGKVTCCYDSIKDRCKRLDPPCKYFHPPLHLKDQLIQNGRNTLILKKIQMQAFSQNLLHLVPAVFPLVTNGMSGSCNAAFPASMEIPVSSMPASVPAIGWMDNLVPVTRDLELTAVEEASEAACSSSGGASSPSLSYQNQYWNGNLLTNMEAQANPFFYPQACVQGVGGWIAVPQPMKLQMAPEYQPWFPPAPQYHPYFAPVIDSLSRDGVYHY